LIYKYPCFETKKQGGFGDKNTFCKLREVEVEK